MDIISDASLLDGIRRQDQISMKQLYQRYADTIYRFALRTVCNPGDAAEIVNEVLLHVWDKPDNFKGASTLKTWLLGITHNKAVDAVRRNKRHHDNHVSDAVIDLEVDVESACLITEQHAAADGHRFVRQCMETLSPEHRKVVHLTFFEDMSYPDIARVLAIPPGTVKTRMMHAKNLLMNCLRRITRGELVPA